LAVTTTLLLVLDLLTNRLSANPHVSVLLLEAGGKDNWQWFHVPVVCLNCFGKPRADWCYQAEQEAGLGGVASAMRAVAF
jgi:choline dehydrogenase